MSTKYVSDTSAAVLDEIHWCYNGLGWLTRLTLVFTNTEQLAFTTSYSCSEEGQTTNLSDKIFTNACGDFGSMLEKGIRLDYEGGSV